MQLLLETFLGRRVGALVLIGTLHDADLGDRLQGGTTAEAAPRVINLGIGLV